MGQIEQESRCDEGITSFDGGMGLGQFMPETASWIHEKEKALQELGYNPYDPLWSIRAMILYDKSLYGKGCEGWYFAFRAYNGGLGNLKKEIKCADSCCIQLVEECCKRKIKQFSWGVLDFCKVNMEYPRKIFERAVKYER